jgi:SpoIID/LytB domain protein
MLIAVALVVAAVPALLAGRGVSPVQAATTLLFADPFDGTANPAWTVYVKAGGSVTWQSKTSVAAGALKAQSLANGRSLAYAQRALQGHPNVIAIDLDLAASQSSATAQLPLVAVMGSSGRLFQLLRARDGQLVLQRSGKTLRLAGKLPLGAWRHLTIDARGGSNPELTIGLAGKTIYDNSTPRFLNGASFYAMRLGSDREGRGGTSFFDSLVVNAGGGTAPSPSPTRSPSPTSSPTATPSPTVSPSPSPTSSATPTFSPSPSPTSTSSPATCLLPPSPSPTPSTSPSPSVPPSVSPTPSSSPSAPPSSTPSPSASPSPSSSPTPTPTPEPRFYFWGRGTDHGVGMSQWGARGRALAGQTYDEILHFYYTNVEIATIDGARPIRVRIGSDFTPAAGCPARLTSVQGDWTSSAFDSQVFSVGSYLEMWPDAIAPAPPAPPAAPTPTPAGWTAIVYSSQGTEIARTPTRDASMDSVLEANGLVKVSFKDSHPNMNQFRDSVRLMVNSNGTLDQINTLPLDYYLLGVVPSEMPGSWHLEAVKAQAVAARSYAWPRIDGSGDYDIGASASQNYKGFLHEYPNSNRAVLETAGQVITYNGRVVAAYYHSSSGGHTENSEYAFVTPAGNPGSVVGYCRGKPDVDANGLAYDRNSSDYYWESVSFTMTELSAIYATSSKTNVGQILSLTFNRGVSGRAYQVVMTGTLGTKTVSGGAFSGIFNQNRPSGSNLVSNMFYLTPVGEGPGG